MVLDNESKKLSQQGKRNTFHKKGREAQSPSTCTPGIKSVLDRCNTVKYRTVKQPISTSNFACGPKKRAQPCNKKSLT